MPSQDPHTQLSDSQKDLLEDLYDTAGVSSVDQLPYTDAIKRITNDFNSATGLDLGEADIWKAVKNLGRQGRLGRRTKGRPSSDSCENEEPGILQANPQAGSGS